jgi:multicomponent Na+:H+ antiporter subunit F
VTALALVALSVAGLCFAARLVAGPTLSDRVIGLDGLVIVGVAAVAVRAVVTGNGSFLPVLVVVTMVGFVGTAASARFIEARDTIRADEAAAGGPDDRDGEVPS